MGHLREGIILLILILSITLAQPLLMSTNVGLKEARGSGSSYVTDVGDFVRIGDEFLELSITFGNETGGGIYSIVDKGSGIDFIKRKDVVGVLFALTYWSRDTNNTEAMSGRDALSITRVKKVDASGAWLNMTWWGLSSTEGGKRFDVTVNVAINVPSGSKLSYWYFDVDNREDLIIEQVSFPLIYGVSQISDEQSGDYLVAPQGPGILCKNPSINFKPGVGLGGVYYPSAHYNMQFIAYYATMPNTGLYLADYDPTGAFVKTFGAVNRDGCLLLSNDHVPEFSSNIKLRLLYPVVIGVFEGDWWDVAQLYKGWAVNQRWVAQGTIAQRTDIPQWLKTTGIAADVLTRFCCRDSHSWNGPFSNLPGIAEAMRQYYLSAPLLWWRGWEKYGAGMASPDFLSPTEGWPSFRSAINETHANGGRVSVLPLTSCYSFNTTDWQDFVLHAPRDREGNLYISNWSIQNDSESSELFAFVVNPSELWCDRLCQMVNQLASAGVDMVQLDGSPVMPFIDWSGSDGHQGGGTWWAEGWMTAFSSVRDQARSIDPDLALGGEWYGEPYIPLFDAANEPSSVADDPLGICGGECYDNTLNTYIPLWHSVYHEYEILYSMMALIDSERAQQWKLYYLRGLAIALVWGEIPMVDMDPQGTGEPDNLRLYDAEMLEYSRRIAQTRTTSAYSYLVEGRMLRPLDVGGVPLVTIPGAKEVPYSMADIPPFVWPGVMGSAWESPDGSIGIVLTSISSSPVNVSISLSKLGVGSRCLAYSVRNGNFTLFNPELAPPDSISVVLNPLDVYLLVLANPESSCVISLDIQPKLTGIVVDNMQYNSDQMPLAFVWTKGTTHSLEVQTVVQPEPGVRHVFEAWSDGNSSASRTLLVSSATALVAHFRTEYQLSASSLYGSPSGAGWYRSGSVARLSIQGTMDYGNGTRRALVGWYKDGLLLGSDPDLTIEVTEPASLEIVWATQYRVEVSSEQGTATGGGWFAPGSNCSVSVSPASIPKDLFTNYVFEGWKVNGTIVSTSPSYSFTVIGSVSLTANWNTELNLVTTGAVAGVAILLIVAVVLLASRRSKFSGSNKPRTDFLTPSYFTDPPNSKMYD